MVYPVMRMAYYLFTRITLLVRAPKVSALPISNLAYFMTDAKYRHHWSTKYLSALLLPARDRPHMRIARFMPALHVRVSISAF